VPECCIKGYSFANGVLILWTFMMKLENLIIVSFTR